MNMRHLIVTTCLGLLPLQASATGRYPDQWKGLENAVGDPLKELAFDIKDPFEEAREAIKGVARPVVAFTERDLDAIPADASGLFQKLPNGRIRVKAPNGATLYEMTNADWLKFVNDQEKRAAAAGSSLRDAGDLVLERIPTNVRGIRDQIVRELGIEPEAILDKIKAPIAEANCPNLDLSRIAEGLDKIPVNLADGGSLDAKSLLHRIDRTQSVLCSLGYSMLDSTMRDALQNLQSGNVNIDGLVQDLLGRRKEIFRELNIDDLTKGFNLEEVTKVGNMAEIAKDIVNLENLQNFVPGPEMIKQIRVAKNVKEVAELVIPSLPEFELPGKPKRTPLNVKKKKEWDGLKVGKQSVVALEGFAAMEMGGSEVSETLRATAEGNLYIFGKVGNVLNAEATLTVGEAPDNPRMKPGDGVHAYLRMQVVGYDLFTAIDKGDALKLAYERPDAFSYKTEIVWQQTFMIGPVPVAVRAGGFIDAGLGFGVGLINTKVAGYVTPHAYIGGFASGGVGIAGLLSGGAAAKLTILGLRAPVSGGAQLMFDPEGYPFLRVFIDTDVDLHMLDGLIYAYAEFPVPFKIKKETVDIFKFKGPEFNHKIMSWKIDIGRKGSTMAGDIIDQSDRDEAGLIQKAIGLDNRNEALENYRKDLKQFVEDVFKGMDDDQKSKANDALMALPDEAAARAKAIDDRQTQIMNQLKAT